MSGGSRLVETERSGHVWIIRLNRPEALNAVHATMAAEVAAAVDVLDADPELRVGVITGAGRAFCAGVDLKAVARGEDVLVPGHPEWGFAGVTQRVPAKPLIAAVNGLALGGGCELVLACDLAVMNDSTYLGLPEVTRGVFAGGGGVVRLGASKWAMEALLTGDPVPAERAAAWGLVNRIVPAAQVLPAALELAGRIAANSPSAVRVTKRLARTAGGAEAGWVADVWTRNAAESIAVLQTPDAREGARAFAEHREPRWQSS
jgi:crotonobetainyl-CoA hydratase